MALEQEAIRFRQLTADWEAAVNEVQNSTKFHDFLLPKSFETLSAAAVGGPVVILNAGDLRSSCDAVIVRCNEDPIHVPLLEFSLSTAKKLVRIIRTLPNATREDRTMVIKLPDARDPDVVFQEVLAQLWKFVVQPVLRALNLKV